ncbi:MAG: hypothetical protein WBE08_10570 [Methyloceanibacter sp.]|jgi:hypothetical protein
MTINYAAVACMALMVMAALSPSNAQEASSEALSQEANDPTASLITLQFANWYTSDFHNLPDADSNTVVFRPVIPFKTGTSITSFAPRSRSSLTVHFLIQACQTPPCSI